MGELAAVSQVLTPVAVTVGIAVLYTRMKAVEARAAAMETLLLEHLKDHVRIAQNRR